MDDLNNRLQKAKEFIEELSSRELIHDSTDLNNLISLLAAGKKTYLGIDPTADFLHLGHYVGFCILKKFINAGYPVVILIGSLTARIGDPSFRSKERQFNPNIDHNTSSIRDQIEKLFFKELQKVNERGKLCEIIDNYDFHNQLLLGEVNLQNKPIEVLLKFFNSVCAHIKVMELAGRDFLRERLQHGLTLQEFLYTCLQGWDFLNLYCQKQVAIQIGGQDQWSNMLTGLTLISKTFARDRHLEALEEDDKKSDSDADENSANNEEKDKNNKQPHLPSIHAGIITFPLITDGTGKKFGKSEGNAICISGGDEAKNAYLVRQYFLNSSDAMVSKYLFAFTDYSVAEINGMAPEKLQPNVINEAKTKLADLVCKDLFGEELSEEAELVSQSMFNRSLWKVQSHSYEQLKSYAKLLPFEECSWVDNISIYSLFKLLNFVPSRSEFNRLIRSKGIYVGYATEEDLADVNCVLKMEHVVWENDKKERGFALIQKGQKLKGLVHVTRTIPLALDD